MKRGMASTESKFIVTGFELVFSPQPSVISTRLFSANAKKLEILDGFRGLWMETHPADLYAEEDSE